MGQTVKLRRSAVPGKVPNNSQLQLGELSVNTSDGKVFFAKSGSLGPSIEEIITTNTQNTGSIDLVGALTASVISGSFIGDGSNLYGIPASGVTGLSLDRIASSTSTASIDEDGLHINTDTTVTGSLTATEFTGSGLGLTNVPINISGSSHTATNYDESFTKFYFDDSTGIKVEGDSTTGVAKIYLDGVASEGGGEGTTKLLTVATPSSVWTFNHGLGEQYPTITVFDSDDNVIIPQNIEAVSSTQLVVSFASPQAGFVTATIGGGLPSYESTDSKTFVVENGTPTWKDGILSGSISFNSYTSSVDSSIDSIRDDFNTHTSSVSGINTDQTDRLNSLESFTGSIDETYATDEDVNELRGDLNAYTSSTDGRLGSLETISSSHDGRLDSLETISSSHDGRLDSIESKTGSFLISSDLSTLEGQVGSLETESGSIRTTLNSYTSSNDTKNTEQDNRLSSLEVQTGSLVGDVSDLSGRVNSLETTSGSHNTRIGNLETFKTNVDQGLEFTGSNVTIKGDLLVKGTETRVNSTTVEISDNVISLNGSGAANGGIEVRDVTSPNLLSGSLIWDGLENKWKGGSKGSEDNLVLEGDFNTFTSSVDGTMRDDFNQYTSSTDDNLESLESFTSSIDDTIKTKLNTETVVSGSDQVVTLLSNRDLNLGSGDLTAVTGSFGDLSIDDTIQATNFTGSFLRLDQNGSGMRMTNVGAFDNDGSDNFRIFSTNDLIISTGGDAGTTISLDGSTKDATFQGNIILSGTVDGVDVSGLKTSFDTTTGSLDGRLDSLESFTGSIDETYATDEDVNQLRGDLNSYTSSNDSTNTTQNSRLTSLESETGSYTTTDYFTTGATFNSGDGVVTGTRNDGGTWTVDLDGRYLTSFTETDPIFTASPSAGIAETDITNWDTAYGWGDHSQVGYITGFTNTNEFVTGATFNNGDGVVTFTRNNGGDTFTVDLDGRYLTSFTETDPIFTASPSSGIAETDITNWDTAYGWGDHSQGGYLTTYNDEYTTGATFNGSNGIITFTRNDGDTFTLDISSTLTDITVTGGTYNDGTQTLTLNKSDGGSIDVTGFAVDTVLHTTGATFNTSDGVVTFTKNGGDTYTVDLDGRYLTSFTETDPIFTASPSAGIAETDITNWDTAYGWGDHSQVGYITGYTETDTLDDVVQRGGTTSSWITVGSLLVSNTAPLIDLVDTNSFSDVNDRFRIRAHSNTGQIRWYDASSTTDTVLMTFNPDGTIGVDGNIDMGTNTITDTKVGQWDTAYGWGDHASVGYITGYTDTNEFTTGVTFNDGNGVLTFTRNNGGDTFTVDLDGRYLTSFAETDPIFTASPSAGIAETDITNWDTAYGWGDHSQVGYITGFTETDPIFTASEAFDITATNKSNWNTAYGWGDHSQAGYTGDQDLSGYLLNTTDTFSGNLTFNGGNNNSKESFINVKRGSGAGLWLKFQTDSTSTNNVSQFVIRRSTDNVDILSISATSGNLTVPGTLSASGYNNTNWDTAYGWGDHSQVGYITGFTNTNEFTTGATFNSSNGVLTFTRNNGGDTFTVDIDGKYAESGHNHDTQYLENSYVDVDMDTYDSDKSLLLGRNLGGWSSGTKPAGAHNGFGILHVTTHVGGYATQFGFDTNQNKMWVRSKNPTSWGSWEYMYTTQDFSTTDISNWDTAYGWGDHSQAGYITGFTNTNEFTTGATFNSSDGIITFTRNNGGDTYTVDLDGRYLQLGGGTLTGDLTLSGVNPQINFNGTSDAGVDMAIKATPEGLDFYEPEDGNKIHFQILDDTGVNAAFGLQVGGTNVISSSRVLQNVTGNISMFTNDSEYLTTYNDEYTTGVTWNGSNGILTFTRNDGDTYTVDISSTLTDVTVTGGTYDDSTQTLTLTKSDSNTVDVTGFAIESVKFTTGATFNTGNGIITFTNNDATTYNVDIDSRYLQLGGGTLTGDLTVGSTSRASNTVIKALSNDDHRSGFEAYGSSQGNGYLYVGQSTTHGGGISYNGDSSPGYVDGETSDYITFYRREAGTNTEVFAFPYSSNEVYFNGNVHSGGGNSSQWNTAVGWGDHSQVGYLTGFTETDPIFTASEAFDITATNKSNWNTAYGWGNHAGRYMTEGSTLSDPDIIENGGNRYDPNANNPSNEHYAIVTFGNRGNVTGQLATHYVSGKLYSRGHNSTWSSWRTYWDDSDFTSTNVTNWNTAYGWGDHSGVYLGINDKAADSELLDGVNSTSFLRSDTADTATELTVNTLKIGSSNKIQFANNDFIRYDDSNGVGRFHFDSDGSTNNSSVQAATFVGALSGNASTASFATDAKWISFPDGPRDLTDRLPNWNNRSVAWDFVTAGTASGDGNYAGVMTFSPWDGTSSSTGDSSYQLAFVNLDGVNASGTPGLRLRNGIDTTWNDWVTLFHTGNFTDNSANWDIAHGWGDHSGLYLPIGGKAADSDLLDGINSTSFLRSDTADTISATLTMGTQKALVANNYGRGVYGIYSATRYQHVWSMGTAYNLSDDGTSSGNLYGLSFTHTNIGGQSKSGLDHQLLVMRNGVTVTALGTGVWTDGRVTTTSDGNSSQWNTAYGWGNHASGGYLTSSSTLNASNMTTGTLPDVFSSSTRYNIGFIDGSGSQSRDKIRVWDSSEYTIGMKNGYDYGHIGSGEYAMSFQMSNTAGRGWWWGDTSHNDDQGAASLTTEGKMVIAKSLSIGQGETITNPSDTPLYVEGTTAGDTVFEVQGTQGQLFSITDDLTGDLFEVSDISGIPILTVNASGTVTVDDTLHVTGDVIAYYSSDERLKDNIKPIENAMDKIKLIGGYEFDWNQSSKNVGHDVGVIAQEVEKVIPELVTTRTNGYKAVKYDKLTALLIQSNKELIEKVEELEKKLNDK